MLLEVLDLGVNNEGKVIKDTFFYLDIYEIRTQYLKGELVIHVNIT